MYGNNGNGNGGYGYGGMNEDYIDRMNRAKKVDNERDPFIGEGQHVLALLELFEYMHDEKGPTAKARFVVLQSAVHPVGSTVVKLWFLTKPGKFKDSVTDSDRFADFILKLKGVDPTKNPGFQVGGEIRRLIRHEVAAQPERGRILYAKGRNVAKPPKDPFIDVSWQEMQTLQTPEQIAQKRAELDSNELLAYSRQLQKLLRDIQSMGQMQQAPHAANQPQYAPPQQQWQQPGPAGQPMYSGATGTMVPPPGYGQPPQQQWQQPPQQQYAPQGAPQQGYGQPMQSPVPPQQPQWGQPQQPAPQQGGFGAQLPPQGGNGGGWNNGGQQ